jgi:hypothetical protein
MPYEWLHLIESEFVPCRNCSIVIDVQVFTYFKYDLKFSLR